MASFASRPLLSRWFLHQSLRQYALPSPPGLVWGEPRQSHFQGNSNGRTAPPPNQRLPTFVYIDECQDYIAKDSNFTVILEQARKQKVGLIVAHQYLTQLSQTILDSLHANTSIKFAGGVSDRDAHALARNMRTTPEFIESHA